MDGKVELMQRVWYVNYEDVDYTVYENTDPSNWIEVYHDGKKLKINDPISGEIWELVKEHVTNH